MPSPASRTEAQAREALVAALQASLTGPFDSSSGTETLPIPPSRFYLYGFLAPQEARTRDDDPTADDELGAGDDPDAAELPAPDGAPKPRGKGSFLPASLGLSVLLPPGDDGALSATVSATVTWADYTALEEEDEGDDSADDQEAPKKGRRKSRRDRVAWVRVARPPVTLSVPLDAKTLTTGVNVPGSEGLVLVGKLAVGDAPGLDKGTRALSLFLVNRREPTASPKQDLSFVFQVSLSLAFKDARGAGFVARPNRQHEDATDTDDRVADLQYREHVEHVVGHGVGVQAIKDEDGEVRHVTTTWLPRAEVPRVESHESPNIETRMDALAQLGDAATVRAALAKLPHEYGAWIDQQAMVAVDSERRAQTRGDLVTDARRARKRIEEGIALLASDDAVRRAFCTMNAAMASQQKQRTQVQSPRWRMFQLAFVLMNLPSIADPHHTDRDTAELIFFPTGGGKTEAYLGVIGFTLVLRRMRRRALPDEGLGTAVILRYTLRLLTLDQLQRAATLVCALEMLRRADPATLGSERFTVGLWVGRKATANTLHEVAKKILDYRNSQSAFASSPFPLTECPWCQAPLEKASFDLRPSQQKPEDVIVSCVRPSCPFSARNSIRQGSPQGLPVLFVDEQIYRELPAFLVSTVDKFALLPWRGETGKLFGRVHARDGARAYGPTDGKPPSSAKHLPEGLLPPELIVQDELHLISGPLGTMVGLYEGAIEQLSTRRAASAEHASLKPKLLASTATVKRAREQIRALFGRHDTAIFPPPGVDALETFFSKVDRKSEGRLYLGVAAQGRPSKAAMHDVYNALLASAAKLHADENGDALGPSSPADPYLTLVGYFNALRELGGMRRLVEDQVHSRVRKIEERRPADWNSRHPWAKNRVIGQPVELTSREKTADIARTKARMTKPFTDREHVDVVLASNMISVGVDIERLGLMVVAGQPKSTNEYIQATSRVGRKKPGLVVVVFNPVKPRDRSHYERFAAYHDAFYRFVEATSVTPFSGPALQRGLAGVVVALARQAEPSLTPSAAMMKLAAHRAQVERHIEALADRAARERPNLSQAEATKIRTAIAQRAKNLLDAWELIAKEANDAGGNRCYSPWDPDKKGKPLLFQATDDTEVRSADELKFAAPSSMRDVEASVHLWVQRGPLGGRAPG